MKKAPDTDRLPDYIQRGGEIVFSPPGVAKGVRMYAFMLRADPERLTRMFNCYLNEPSGGVARIVPVGSTIVLNVVELKHVGALTPPDNVRGYFRELEMAIWTLGYDEEVESYATFVPYMIVDRGSAMAMGREVYGFPKQLGTVTLPPDASEFTVTVDGVLEWDADSAFTPQRLVTIPWHEGLIESTEAEFNSQADLVADLARVLETDRVIEAVNETGLVKRLRGALQLLAEDTLPMIFLKQIRDARRPTKACYQSIHWANFKVTEFRRAGHLLPSTIQLNDLASMPIRRELGLPAGELTPIAAFWVDFDFTLSVAEQAWVTPPPVSVQAVVPTSTGDDAGP